MKTIRMLGALCGLGLLATVAAAQPPAPPPVVFPFPRPHPTLCYYPAIPQAPDACRPGMYQPNCLGMVYGPNYAVYPSFPAWNGAVPTPAIPPPVKAAPQPQIPSLTFPTHPYARGPRDFFMID